MHEAFRTQSICIHAGSKHKKKHFSTHHSKFPQPHPPPFHPPNPPNMRLLTLLSPALLAATISASDSNSSSSDKPAAGTEDPTPVGQLWTASWTPDDLAPYKQSCLSKSTYKASVYKLSEMYPTLEDYAANLKLFYHQQQ